MSSFKRKFVNRPQHDTDKSRDAFIKQASDRFNKALDKKKVYGVNANPANEGIDALKRLGK